MPGVVLDEVQTQDLHHRLRANRFMSETNGKRRVPEKVAQRFPKFFDHLIFW